MKTVEIGRLSWVDFKEAVEETDVLIIPVGGMTENGMHLPMGATSEIAEACAMLSGEKAKALVAPVFPYGYNPPTKSFPGAATLTLPTLRKVLFAYAESYVKHGIKKIMFVNGSEYNTPVFALVAADLYDKYKVLATFTQWWGVLPKMNKEWKCDEKGGYYETSLFMACKPDAKVDTEAYKVSKPLELSSDIVCEKGWKCKGTSLYFPVDLYKAGKEGCFGMAPDGANAELGKTMMEAYADFNAGLIEELRKINL